jgi:hypothetical protein
VTGNDEPGWRFRKRDRDCAAAASGVTHRKVPTANETKIQGLFTGFSPSHAPEFHNSFILQAAQPGEIGWIGKAQQTEAVTGDSH